MSLAPLKFITDHLEFGTPYMKWENSAHTFTYYALIFLQNETGCYRHVICMVVRVISYPNVTDHDR